MDQGKELQELFAAAGPPEAPPNLGNIPDEVRAETPEPPAPVEAPPADEPTPEPAETPAPEVPVAEPVADPAAERLKALEQEIAFLRAGQQAQAVQQQAPAIPQYGPENILPAAITASDLERLGIQGTPEAVEYVNNFFRLTALSAKEAAKQELRAEYQQGIAVQQSGQNLRTAFYGANPDLEPYYEVVGAIATSLQQQYPQATAQQLMTATAQQARQRLAAWGVQPGTTVPQAAQPAKVAKQRIKPASAESGAAARGAGPNKLTSVEKDILQMLQAG